MYVVEVDGDRDDLAILWALEGDDPSSRGIGSARFG